MFVPNVIEKAPETALLEDESSFKGTTISSVYVTKVHNISGKNERMRENNDGGTGVQ